MASDDVELPAGYPWPPPQPKYTPYRGQARPTELERTIQKILAKARREFWEARMNNPTVHHTIKVAIGNNLTEAEALLLTVGQLLEENRELMAKATIQIPLIRAVEEMKKP